MEKGKLDIVIIGCGPAGLSAALNAKIRQKNFILLGTNLCSAKMDSSPWIDNFLGEHHISGKDLREKFLRHIEKAAIEITHQKVDMIYAGKDGFTVHSKDQAIETRTVIVATGVEYGKLLKGEEEFVGNGVSYCATCDGPLFQKKTVAMLVYSKDGLDEVKFLAQICKEVVIFPMFKGDLSLLPQNVIINYAEPLEIGGTNHADRVDTDKGAVLVDGIFIFRDVVSPARLIPGIETLNGAIKVNKDMETNLPGLFAAGDCTGSPFQLAKAIGQGQVAVLNAVHYLDKE